MLLALDIGNTNITVGLYRGADQVRSWRLQTLAHRTSDEYGLLVHRFLELAGYGPDDIQGVILASVVPVLTPTFSRLSTDTLGQQALIVGPGIKTGLPVLYDPPKDVGADRVVNAVAAFTRYESACIVVDFGTATTFDSITAKGEYAGGAIAPGIRISMDALFARAARLPKVDIARPKVVVGRSTVESIQSGIFFGYVALVDGLVRRMRAEMASEPVRVIATGGLAASLAEESETIEDVDEDLTLEGLRLIYEQNRA